jgi:NADH-quinone oxidoreductase subunit J
MQAAFWIIASIVVASALAAVRLRRLVHCVLCLTLTFAGIAALFLQLGAEFIGFAQILVYVGAVSILMVFAILLTRDNASPAAPNRSPASTAAGLTVAGLVLGCLAACILTSPGSRWSSPAPEVLRQSAQVQNLGDALMSRYVLPLEVLGLLLTAAMIGAVILAWGERKGDT